MMKDLQEKVREFIEKNNLEMKPEFCTLDIVSEIGEVAKEILKMYEYGRGDGRFRKEIKSELKDDLRSELGDVLYSLINLANYYGVDLDEEVINVMRKYEKRILKGKTPDSENQ
jgi:NTP pyrophosphatase (non-canonical NTP hydrolase)